MGHMRGYGQFGLYGCSGWRAEQSKIKSRDRRCEVLIYLLERKKITFCVVSVGVNAENCESI